MTVLAVTVLAVAVVTVVTVVVGEAATVAAFKSDSLRRITERCISSIWLDKE